MTDPQDRARRRARTLSVISIAAVSLAGASLILLVPTFFRPDAQVQGWLLAVLALLVAVSVAGARHWRRAGSRADHD